MFNRAMDKKKLILLIIAMIFIILPLLEQFTCSEPEVTLSSWVLMKIGLIDVQPVCPTAFGTLLKVLINICLAVAAGIAGYIFGQMRKVEKFPNRPLGMHPRVWAEDVQFPEDFMHESLLNKRSIF